MLKGLEAGLSYLLEIIDAIRLHWTSPEFRPVLWAVLAYVIGAAQGYVACLDAEEAARADADRAGLAASVAGEKEEYNG